MSSAPIFPAVPNAAVNAVVMAVFHARAATTPKAALAREIMVATTSLLKRLVRLTICPTTTGPTGSSTGGSWGTGGSPPASLMSLPPSLRCARVDQRRTISSGLGAPGLLLAGERVGQAGPSPRRH